MVDHLSIQFCPVSRVCALSTLVSKSDFSSVLGSSVPVELRSTAPRTDVRHVEVVA